MMDFTQVRRYPLQWPFATPRTKPADRRSSQFKRTEWNTCVADLKHELHLLGADIFWIMLVAFSADALASAKEKRLSLIAAAA